MTRGAENRQTSTEITAVDLFCGAGGLTRGLLDGGVNVVAGVDVDAACKFAYETNNEIPFLERSVVDLKAAEVNRLLGNARFKLLAGCAPCQPFSTYTQGRKAKRDEKWGLLSHFGRLIDEVGPDFVTMENVPQLRNHSVFRQFVRTLKSAGYHVNHAPVYGPAYGIPQARTRLVLLASRHGQIELIPPTHEPSDYPDVRSAIYGLKRLEAGDRDPKDPLHRAASLSELNLRRIRASKPGGTWEDWDPDLVTPCHRSEKGDSYKAVYGRMAWDRPAPTMTTQCYAFGSGRFGHPDQDRAITLREAALLQTFPPSYKFLPPDGSFNFRRLGDLIGNAVPVALGHVIADSLYEHVRALGVEFERA